MDPTSILRTLTAKEEALVTQIANLQNELDGANTTLTELRDSKSSLETLVSTIASKWVSNDKPVKRVIKKTKPKKTKTDLKPEPEPEPEPETEPEPEPDTKTESSKDEEGFVVTFKGTDYVVFPDNFDVICSDDKEEEVVGRWDPDNKVIVFN